MFALPLWGEGTSIQFQRANRAYESGNFEQAAALYDSLIAEGFESGELHYNLGNAFFRLDQLGKAILHYERALLLAPGDADALHNLAFAKQNAVDDFEEIPDFFLRSWWHRLRDRALSFTWGIVAFAFWFAGFGGLAIWQLSRQRRVRKTGFIAGVMLLLVSLLPLSLALGRAAIEQHSGRAVVMNSEASLRSAPDKAGTELLLLHEGTEIDLLDKLGDWEKVRLPNGEEGWLPLSVFEEI